MFGGCYRVGAEGTDLPACGLGTADVSDIEITDKIDFWREAVVSHEDPFEIPSIDL